MSELLHSVGFKENVVDESWRHWCERSVIIKKIDTTTIHTVLSTGFCIIIQMNTRRHTCAHTYASTTNTLPVVTHAHSRTSHRPILSPLYIILNRWPEVKDHSLLLFLFICSSSTQQVSLAEIPLGHIIHSTLLTPKSFLPFCELVYLPSPLQHKKHILL